MQLLPHLRVPARAHAACVTQDATFVIREEQSTDFARRVAPVCEANYNKLLPQAALQLEPGIGPSRHIRRIPALGHHAFKPHLARGFQHLRWRQCEVLGKVHAVVILGERLLQYSAP